ncbi:MULTISPECIES: hypothetical protein [unclassified Bradyrhizobium]|nr:MULTISPECIES: hypothetical protein [unclassified Bradyrhizobium]
MKDSAVSKAISTVPFDGNMTDVDDDDVHPLTFGAIDGWDNRRW